MGVDKIVLNSHPDAHVPRKLALELIGADKGVPVMRLEIRVNLGGVSLDICTTAAGQALLETLGPDGRAWLDATCRAFGQSKLLDDATTALRERVENAIRTGKFPPPEGGEPNG